MTERLLHLFTVLTASAGLVRLLLQPETAIFGYGHPGLSGTVHLLTLGGVLGAALLVQQRQWQALYGGRAVWPPLLLGVLVFQVGGVSLFVWGLVVGDTLLAHVGGHYWVPTGIVLAVISGGVAAWRRPAGTPRRAAAHLPGLGLLVAMSLGALLVMEAHTPRYGLYNLATVAVHALAAGFLFVLPLVQMPASLRTGVAPVEEADPLTVLRWYAITSTGALGVLFIALALSGQGPGRMLPLGLAMLGALLVWLGLPEGGRLRAPGRMPGAWAPLAGRLATGVLLFYAALRFAGGAAPGDALWLGKVGVLLFLAGIALPDLFSALEPPAAARGTALRRGLWLLGTAALLAGQIWALGWAVQGGTAICLGALLWHGWCVQRGGLGGRR